MHTLSLHDALPICQSGLCALVAAKQPRVSEAARGVSRRLGSGRLGPQARKGRARDGHRRANPLSLGLAAPLYSVGCGLRTVGVIVQAPAPAPAMQLEEQRLHVELALQAHNTLGPNVTGYLTSQLVGFLDQMDEIDYDMCWQFGPTSRYARVSTWSPLGFGLPSTGKSLRARRLKDLFTRDRKSVV